MILAFGILVNALMLMAVTAASAAPPYIRAWSVTLEGWNRSSSPVIADIDGDGQNEIVVGHQDGILRAYEGDGTPKWQTPAVPGINRAANCNEQTTPSAIDSSPAVADIDGDQIPEIIVGVGSTFVPYQNGSVISFDGQTGQIEWAFAASRDSASLWDGDTPIPDKWCEPTYATPAVGDVDGDGRVDVVFGSWDFFIWAVDGSGVPLPGFPFNSDDTVWSSPALFDMDGDGDVEIFIGGDSTPRGYFDHLGGVFRAIDYRNNQPVELWNRVANEVFHSSPAIGDINADGRYEAIVAMGNNWHIECTQRQNPLCSAGDGTDHTKVWAFHLDDGTNVPGWPVNATDTIWSSPAIGDIDSDGLLEVVAGSYDSRVYAWNPDGTILWSLVPQFPHPALRSGRATGHPIIADLDGDGDQDVAVATDVGLATLDGPTGASLESGVRWQDLISFALSGEAAPAVGVLNDTRHMVVSAFDTLNRFTRISAVQLPASQAEDAWPMFRRGPLRQGSVVSTAPVAVSVEDVRLRDSLIGEQEALLNTYRCRYVVDTHIVSGGCANGVPTANPDDTMRFEGVPTPKELWLRDNLINRQESLLNTYRCRFDVDTQVVPGGCVNGEPAPAEASSDTAPNDPALVPTSELDRSVGMVAVAAGGRHSCGLRVDRRVVCWGDDGAGQVAAPVAEFLAVAAGGRHSCGLRVDRRVVCWGDDGAGQVAAPVAEFLAVAAGGRHSCGIRINGTITCWGEQVSVQSGAPLAEYLEITVGESHACGIRTNGVVSCWGNDRQQQTSPPDHLFTKIDTGASHSCGITSDLKPLCWGADRFQQSTVLD